jgi:hypothetical protein
MTGLGIGCPTCKKTFNTEHGLDVHMGYGCAQMLRQAQVQAASVRSREDAAFHQQQEERRKRTLLEVFCDDMLDTVALDLAVMRYLKLIPGKHVDFFKDNVKDWLGVTLCGLKEELHSCLKGLVTQTVLDSIDSTLTKRTSWFSGAPTAISLFSHRSDQ